MAPDGSLKPVGMFLAPLTSETRAQFNISSNASGVLVENVVPGSNADESGIQAGDVIERVAGKSVSMPDQVASSIHNAEHESKQAVSMYIMRNGQTSYVGLQLEA